MRRTVVLVLEGLLLITVLATAGYYLVLALDDGQTFNMRLLGGWVAFLLLGLTFVAPVRDRIDRIGTPAASDYASFLYGGVILLVMLTAGGMMMGMRKDGPSALFIFTFALLCGMFFWPDLRHRIQTGAWR